MPPQLNNMNDDDEMFPRNDRKCFINKPLGHLHNFYLVGEIRDPEEYTLWFEVIRNAKETDVVYIHINSPGGSIFTALQMIRAMHESKGTIVASVEGMCISAATLIFLNSHQCEVSDHSIFMFHNYSGVTIGKGGEMFDHISAAKKWSTRLLHTMYKDFLEKSEIDSVLDNKDLWMDSTEVIARLGKKAASQKLEMAKDAKVAKEAKKAKDAIIPVHAPQDVIRDAALALEQTVKKKNSRRIRMAKSPLKKVTRI